MEARFSGGEDKVLEPVLKSLLYVNVAEIKNKSFRSQLAVGR